MTTTYPKISPTEDPRVRIASYGPRNFRTQVQDEPGADWSITGQVYLTRAEALLSVEDTLSRHFGEPTHTELRLLRARIARLETEKADLAEKLSREKDRATALYVDGDRRERRALALLPDCEAHRGELQYLRHCVSWYWHNMNDSDGARAAVVTSLMLTARGAREAGPDATVKAADVADWLEKAVAKQNKPLHRTSFPTLADCLRSAHGDCEHDTICGDVIAEVVAALGLTLAEQPAKCKPVTCTGKKRAS